MNNFKALETGNMDILGDGARDLSKIAQQVFGLSAAEIKALPLTENLGLSFIAKDTGSTLQATAAGWEIINEAWSPTQESSYADFVQLVNTLNSRIIVQEQQIANLNYLIQELQLAQAIESGVILESGLVNPAQNVQPVVIDNTPVVNSGMTYAELVSIIANLATQANNNNTLINSLTTQVVELQGASFTSNNNPI